MEAERVYGIPLFGTMAHSFIEIHDDEITAFENYARARSQNLTLLIDTYDTENGRVVRSISTYLGLTLKNPLIASVLASRPLPMLRHSIAPISFRNMLASRAASAPPGKRPGRAASRCLRERHGEHALGKRPLSF
jgi:hypothetical protein